MFQDIELLYGKNPNFPQKIKLAVEGLHIKKNITCFQIHHDMVYHEGLEKFQWALPWLYCKSISSRQLIGVGDKIANQRLADAININIKGESAL